jgi:hypothetical protein
MEGRPETPPQAGFHALRNHVVSANQATVVRERDAGAARSAVFIRNVESDGFTDEMLQRRPELLRLYLRHRDEVFQTILGIAETFGQDMRFLFEANERRQTRWQGNPSIVKTADDYRRFGAVLAAPAGERQIICGATKNASAFDSVKKLSQPFRRFRAYSLRQPLPPRILPGRIPDEEGSLTNDIEDLIGMLNLYLALQSPASESTIENFLAGAIRKEHWRVRQNQELVYRQALQAPIASVVIHDRDWFGNEGDAPTPPSFEGINALVLELPAERAYAEALRRIQGHVSTIRARFWSAADISRHLSLHPLER